MAEWTLAGARALLPDVRARTERAVGEIERARGDDERERIVSRWVREMEAFGVHAPRIWCVDFETTGGAFCWHWPEQGVAYFHGDDEGCDARRGIQ